MKPAIWAPCRKRPTAATFRLIGRRMFLLMGLLSVLMPSAVPALAQDIDWKQGKLAHLAPYIGTYHYDAILKDTAVAAALTKLAGADFPVLQTNLNVAAPIAFIGADIVLQGNAPHQGGEEEAIVLVRIFDGTVRAGLLHDGKMTLFDKGSHYENVPPALRRFLLPRPAQPVPEKLPAGAVWKHGQ